MMEINSTDYGIYYACPVTGVFFDVAAPVEVRHLRGPTRTEITFKCANCGDRHTITLIVGNGE